MAEKAPSSIAIPPTQIHTPSSPTASPSGKQHIEEPVENFTSIPLVPAQSAELLQSNDARPQELVGLELLRQVFDSMAVNGKITMDQLPFVLAGAEVQAAAEQVQEAIEEFLPDADDDEALLDFDQVQTLYHQLVQVVVDHAADALLVEGEVSRPSNFQRFRLWLQQRRKERKLRQTAYERHMKPTTRLLLLILITACVISTAVVVFAVLFIFDHTNNAVINHLVRDAELLADGLSLFGYTRPFEHTTSNLERLSTILNVVINELGYNNSKANQLSNLAYQRNLMGDLLDGWYTNDATTTVDISVTITALWIEQMMARRATLADLISGINIMNPSLPSGHEIHLARSNNGRIEPLTAFRYSWACNGICGANDGSTAIRLALAGGNGTTLTGFDYRPLSVAAGYRLLVSPSGVALAYYILQTTLQTEFQQPVKTVVDSINLKLANESNSTRTDVRVNTQEIVLCSKVSGTTQLLTASRFCNATCLKNANLDNSYVAVSLNSTGQGTFTSLSGEPIFVAYKPLVSSGLGLEVKITQEEFMDALYLSLGNSLDDVNSKLSGTEELLLVTIPKAGANVSTNGMKYWTNFRFASDCGSKCGTLPNTSTYLKKALTKCVSGTDHSLDYRSQMVIAGYSCVSSMKAAFSITMADSQIISEGTDMAVTIANYQTMVRYAGKSLEIAIGRKKKNVAVALTKNDYDKFGTRKFGDQCPPQGCTGPSNAVLAAVNGRTGYMETVDYRWVTVLAVYIYLPDLNLGIAMKMDKSEAQAGSFRLTGILCAASVSAVIVSMVVLALLANILLKSMDRAWEEGKKAIEQEKQAFRNVIEAMYPVEVAQRMLAGETSIAYDVPAATVFFSDIYEFTTTSNSVTPEELIRFMGYTFGVMDAIGDHFHVHKVKTIGDAYLGATGLPGMTSLNGNATMDMMLFASSCAQVFSNRFLHPDEGTILAEVVTRMLKKKNLLKGIIAKQEAQMATIPKRPSLISYGHPKDAAGVPPVAEDNRGPVVHCIMRYGLAMGPITAGVLQGKTPLFDIWGKTVNLASRMESTGQAGRIQVAEGVYLAVIKHKDQPFTFESRHKVYCKGFGHVSAYFVDTCLFAPPNDLLLSLHIEPNWGNYLFQNPVPAFGAAKTGPQDPSGRSSNSGGVSPRSALSKS
eukprot:GGOE01033772.1.p1 GENE.GGOE01033772.1~~GGOE01033772.1.p1  ORF type:complete len:1150 (-),score=409.26 GGOE01033772.1:1107-4556(-)